MAVALSCDRIAAGSAASVWSQDKRTFVHLSKAASRGRAKGASHIRPPLAIVDDDTHRPKPGRHDGSLAIGQ